MKINSTLIFLNVTSPFSVLNGLCTGEVEFQAIIAETKEGKMILDSLEQMDIMNLKLVGNQLGSLSYKEFVDWAKQVNQLFACDIDKLISEAAEANVDKAYLLEFAEKIQLPTQNSNRNCSWAWLDNSRYRAICC